MQCHLVVVEHDGLAALGHDDGAGRTRSRLLVFQRVQASIKLGHRLVTRIRQGKHRATYESGYRPINVRPLLTLGKWVSSTARSRGFRFATHL